jgi:6-phosphogluconolactonase (cycloisomerase 2 family)
VQVRSTGQWPAAVTISPDNRNLYVLNATGRSISRFGAAPGFAGTGTTPLPSITGTPQAASTEPRFGFEIASTGQLLYVSDYDADQFQFWGINETDGSLTLRTPVAMPGAGRIHAVNRRF